MSDPKDIPNRHVPQRANPIQPDRPAGATSKQGFGGSGGSGGESSQRAREREEAALDNVRTADRGAEAIKKSDPAMAPNRPAHEAQ